MIVLLLLSVVFVDSSYATANCLEAHQQQLALLNERMNQMLNTLYSSPIISKLLSLNSKSNPSLASLIEKEESPSKETSYYSTASTASTPAQNIICVSPPQTSPSAGALLPVAPSIPNAPSSYLPLSSRAQPLEYTYPGFSNSWPKYEYSYYSNPYTQYRAPYPSNSYSYPPPPYEYSYPPKLDYTPPLYPYNPVFSFPTTQYSAPYTTTSTPYYPIPPYLP